MGRKRSDFDKLRRSRRAERRARVAALYSQGVTVKEIVERVHASRRTVFEDLHALQQDWLKRAAPQRHEAKVQTLVRLDWIEDEALAAWERSKLPHVTEMRETVSGDDCGETVRTRRTTRQQVGDVGFLAVVLDCIALRCRILGLYAAERHQSVEPTSRVPDGLRTIIANLSHDERERMRPAVEHYRRCVSAGYGLGN